MLNILFYLAIDDFEYSPTLLARIDHAMFAHPIGFLRDCLVAIVSLPVVDVGDADYMHLVIGCLLVCRYDAGDGPILHAVVGVIG